MGRRSNFVVAALIAVFGAAGLVIGDRILNADDAVATDGELPRETATELARATAAQGVCFGWQLDGVGPASRGSNLGGTTAVDSDPGRCPRWVEVWATVTYPPESSEADDSASIGVRTSSNLDVGPNVRARLDRFGLDENAFIDDPQWAIHRAALALPLLTAEAGAAEPAPTPTAPPAAAPRALEPAGSDFWRDRRWFVVAAAAFVLVAVAMTVGGLVAGRARRRAVARPGVPGRPAPPRR
jgi:hypothetical protein